MLRGKIGTCLVGGFYGAVGAICSLTTAALTEPAEFVADRPAAVYLEAPAAPVATPNVQVPTLAACSITGPDKALPGRQFVLAFTAPEGASVEIVYPDKLDGFITRDKTQGAFVAPADGEYDFGIIATTTVTHILVKLPGGKTAELELVVPQKRQDVATWTVTVGTPKPPAPLSELAVPHAKELAALYAKSLDALVIPEIDFAGWLGGVNGYLATAGLAENKAVPRITERLTKAGAAGDWKASVKSEVKLVVEELGGSPEPTPPVVEGKRRLVILHETAEDTPAQGMLWIQLRNGAAASYLKSKGHSLDVLDATDSPLYDPAAPFPTLLIFDGDKLLAKVACPTTPAAFLEAVKQHGG